VQIQFNAKKGKLIEQKNNVELKIPYTLIELEQERHYTEFIVVPSNHDEI